MARTIPLTDNPLIIHPAIPLPFSLLAAAMAAAIAILTGLCGYRKKSSNPSSPPSIKPLDSPLNFPAPPENPSILPPPPPPQLEARSGPEEANESITKNRSEETKDQTTTLPLPPALKTLRETNSCNNFSSSTRKLSSSLSVKVPRTMSMGKVQDQFQRKKGKLKAEDSILIRPIILGEKCRVPADEDDAVLYDGKGKRITTYHPKSSASYSLSRNTSIIDQTAIPATTQDRDDNRQKPADEIS